MTARSTNQPAGRPLAPWTPPFPPGVEKLLSKYPRRDGELLALFRVFARSERFLGRVPNLLDAGSPLSLRERELVILRTTGHHRAEYEWGVHVTAFSAAAGLSAEEVEQTLAESIPRGRWDDRERALLEIVGELLRTGHLSPELQQAFDQEWDAAQRLEILMLIGTYSMISFVANVADLPLEDWAVRFPGDGT